MLGFLATAFAFISILLIFVGLSLGRRPSLEKERLSQYAKRARNLEEMELQSPFSDRVLRPVVAQLAGLVSRFTPQSNIESLRRNLILAGNPNNLQANDLLGMKGMAALVVGGGTFVAMSVTKSSTTNTLVFTVLMAAIGFMLPSMWLGQKIGARKALIIKALPDALDLLTISVEAGLGFDAALAKVVEKWNNPLTLEFAHVLAEMRMGKARRDALRDMVARTDVADVTAFIAAIIQVDTLGVSMSRVLQIQSEQMRLRRRQRAEERAREAPVKMTIPMVFLIFPALMIVILGSAVPKILAVMGGM